MSLAECDAELEDDLLWLCVEEWWELGVLDDELLSPEASLVPTGVVGTAVGEAEFDEVSTGFPVLP